jgi:2-dehydropantoate 2-reductase
MAEIAVIGPGAVGATFAAAAERAGGDVLLCGRRPAPAPVVELHDGGEHALARPVLGEAAAVAGPARWVLLAVKTYQTAGAESWLRALCGPGTVVAVLQNGVEHHERAGPLSGPATPVSDVLVPLLAALSPPE